MAGSGIPNPHVIDLVTHDRRADEYVLIMVEDRAWDGSPARLIELEAKTNAYLSYALDGQMAAQYPQSRGRPVRIQLDCRAAPDEISEAFLELLAGAVRSEGLVFAVNVVGPAQPST
ncbi:MAG TPA: DUF6572 domain-containing protein [Gemmatimonadales bacterium]|nr:DUF6572 domain-containing protein [Gemmatimonadales bacterium]